MRVISIFRTDLDLHAHQEGVIVVNFVAKGYEGLRELQILPLLQTEPFKSYPPNAMIQIHDFIYDADYAVIIIRAQNNRDRILIHAVDNISASSEQLITACLLGSICMGRADKYFSCWHSYMLVAFPIWYAT